MKKLIIIALMSVFLISSYAHAGGIGAGPGTITFPKVLRDGFSEKTIKISNINNFPVTINAEIEGEIADWLALESGNRFEIPASTFREIKIVIKPPKDAAIGFYNGSVTFVSSSRGVSIEGYGTAIETAVRLSAVAEITGEQILDFVFKDASVRDTEENLPVEFTVTGENTGNVRATPTVHVDIWDRDREKIVLSHEVQLNEVLPTRTETKKFEISSGNLSIGQYWANVTIYLGSRAIGQKLLTFDIFEKGSLRIKGELLRIENKVWVQVDEIVRFDAVF